MYIFSYKYTQMGNVCIYVVTMKKDPYHKCLFIPKNMHKSLFLFLDKAGYGQKRQNNKDDKKETE